MTHCQHCHALKPNLHSFTESAREFGLFQVVRCLLCGWQTSKLIPRLQRKFSKADIALDDEPDELETRFLKFAADATEIGTPTHRVAF